MSLPHLHAYNRESDNNVPAAADTSPLPLQGATALATLPQMPFQPRFHQLPLPTPHSPSSSIVPPPASNDPLTTSQTKLEHFFTLITPSDEGEDQGAPLRRSVSIAKLPTSKISLSSSASVSAEETNPSHRHGPLTFQSQREKDEMIHSLSSDLDTAKALFDETVEELAREEELRRSAQAAIEELLESDRKQKEEILSLSAALEKAKSFLDASNLLGAYQETLLADTQVNVASLEVPIPSVSSQPVTPAKAASAGFWSRHWEVLVTVAAALIAFVILV